MSQTPSAKPKANDLIRRGSKKPAPAGTATFIGLRLLDIPWQYHLLHNGAADRALALVGLSAISHGDALSNTGIALLDNLGLPLPRLLLVAMATGSTLKQIFWQAYLSQEEFPVSSALPVSIYNTLLNTVNTLLFVCASTSSWFSGPTVTVPVLGGRVPLSILVGALAYAAGITIETLSEYQRKVFKRDPRNQGKVCKVGLWRWARHINYFGYALWRGGYCMAASGWVGGLAMGLFQGWDLSSRAVTVLDEYCTDRYGEQWAQFKKEVPYRMVPGIY